MTDIIFSTYVAVYMYYQLGLSFNTITLIESGNRKPVCGISKERARTDAFVQSLNHKTNLFP